MRISDWSSDVCSSDLHESGLFPEQHVAGIRIAPDPVRRARQHAFEIIGSAWVDQRIILALNDVDRHAQFCPARFEFAKLCLQRSEEHTSELQSLMRISYAVFCLKKKIKRNNYQS